MDYSLLVEAVRSAHPLVFSLTNFVTVGDCANILLAAGASPVMSLDPREVADMAKIAQCVVLNPGTPSESSIEAMLIAGKAANEAHIPVLLDPVGAGATPLRAKIADDLLGNIRFTAIRGNVAEIGFLAGSSFLGRGVDAGSGSVMSETVRVVSELARRTDAVVCASGEVDVISDGIHGLFCRNGHKIMPQITGSGCMSSALCGAFLGAAGNTPFDAICAAVISMGICGEIAVRNMLSGEGTGSFRGRLIDAVSLFTAAQFKEFARYEKI